MLLTSSMKGSALCVCDLHSGTLVRRHEEALAEMDTMPQGADATSIAVVRGGRAVLLGAFGGWPHVWHFARNMEWAGPGSGS